MKIIVKKEGELLEYLYNNIEMPKKRIKQYLTHGSIYVNNNKITKYNYKIMPGMTIIIDTSSKRTEFPFEILLEDEHLLIINKPSGLPIFTKDKENSLYYMINQYLIEKGKNEHAFLIYNLEKEVSGIVVFAKDKKTKNRLQDNWKENIIYQNYAAVLEGHLKDKKGHLNQFLKENKANLVYISKDKSGEEAIMDYKVLKENESFSLVEVKIKNKVKNQIRVGFQSMNCPVLGDIKYGKDKTKETRLYLHCNRIKFYYPEIKKEILIETVIPKDFKNKVK